MSVRKRAWTTSKGIGKEAWVVDYVDQTGKRRLKTFKKKKAADNFSATANVEIRAGIHTADSASKTIARPATRNRRAAFRASDPWRAGFVESSAIQLTNPAQFAVEVRGLRPHLRERGNDTRIFVVSDRGRPHQ